MKTSFSRTLMSLDSDRFRGSLVAIVVGGALAVLWTTWFLSARVALYEISGSARLEVGREPHTVMSLVEGRVIRNHMELDRRVEEGDILVELDPDRVRFRLSETRARAEGLKAQRETLRRELGTQRQAVKEAESGAGSALKEAIARQVEAAAVARLAAEEASRADRLHEQGLLSLAERDRAATSAEQHRSAADALGQAVDRLSGDRSSDVSNLMVAFSALERRMMEIEAAALELEFVEARLERELSLHTLRAPVAGRIGDVTPVRVGEVIDVRQHLGSVVPAGEVRIVAEFEPHRAIGRIQPGQPARLRLEGFSWVQYGTVPARVDRVGSEPRNASVRVELSLAEPDAFTIPLSHGLPGILEVEVERLTPASLVLRAAGRTVSRPVSFERR